MDDPVLSAIFCATSTVQVWSLCSGTVEARVEFNCRCRKTLLKKKGQPGKFIKSPRLLTISPPPGKIHHALQSRFSLLSRPLLVSTALQYEILVQLVHLSRRAAVISKVHGSSLSFPKDMADAFSGVEKRSVEMFWLDRCVGRPKICLFHPWTTSSQFDGFSISAIIRTSDFDGKEMERSLLARLGAQRSASRGWSFSCQRTQSSRQTVVYGEDKKMEDDFVKGLTEIAFQSVLPKNHSPDNEQDPVTFSDDC
ncbi:hypothetical protein L218DRAFT_946691 [Marasmius fiardii PR-910]|nr:hypothetical protein L218DRAFT_946691 [Marasmius fiardii PR-910]